LPKSIDNRFADNESAAHLGKAIFFDTRFSGNGAVACSSCHQPEQYFTDGLAVSQGMGATRRNAPTVVGSGYSPWLFWDGRKDSLWSQALGPLESDVEHGTSRLAVAQTFLRHYRKPYEQLLGKAVKSQRILKAKTPASPDGNEEAQANWQKLTLAQQDVVNQVFADVGKFVMAYQRQLNPLPARFDQFVHQLSQSPDNIDQLQTIMDAEEVQGMRVFMGKGNCASCHNGALFSNFEFHNIGAPEPDVKQVDMGRYQGVVDLQTDEFTCLSKYSDANHEQCLEMRFLKKQGMELVGAFKTPSLRNVSITAPYMQSGQFATLEEVVDHYNQPAPPFYDREQHPSRPHFDILPLGLTDEEKLHLVRFLGTLSGDLSKTTDWWVAPKKAN